MINLGNSYHKYIFHLEQINDAARNEPSAFVDEVEYAFRENLQVISRDILRQKKRSRVIMLSGPSSSGKTTTAHILMEELNRMGVGTVIISLDNFYLGRGIAPLLPDGGYDYESIEALNIPEIERCLTGLIKNGCCDMPVYSFPMGRPNEEKRHIELKENSIAIVEGIHALNPRITSHVPKDGLLKMYISVKQNIKDSRGEVLSHRDIRLIRRIVRDYKHRGVPADETFGMWGSVCRGEDLFIQPFKRTSNITINSIHMYEPCVLQKDAVELLSKIPRDNEQYAFAQRLIRSLSRFESISEELIPKTSLIREFIGGGLYDGTVV